MQNAKDSFYVALRTRLQALNPQRLILLRGIERPGIVVEEAEAPFQQLPSDVFVLRWTGIGAETDLPATLVAADCEIHYQSCGTVAFGGLDRGRAMSTMDSELFSILQPLSTLKFSYATTSPVALQTNVFWDEPVLEALQTQRDRLSRVAHVMVYSYQEQGE